MLRQIQPHFCITPWVCSASCATVAYGVRKGEDGGRLVLAAREYSDRFEIVVSDSGPGFDPAHAREAGCHLGM